jgi:hypothetical protein
MEPVVRQSGRSDNTRRNESTGPGLDKDWWKSADISQALDRSDAQSLGDSGANARGVRTLNRCYALRPGAVLSDIRARRAVGATQTSLKCVGLCHREGRGGAGYDLRGDRDIERWSTYIGRGAVRFYLPRNVQLTNDFFAEAVIVAKSTERVIECALGLKRR